MTSLDRPSRLDRALPLFADVRSGEELLAVLLALNVFLLLDAAKVGDTVDITYTRARWWR